MSARKKAAASHKNIAENRRARFDYEILEKLEVGLVLQGTEVKSLRTNRANIAESYASFENGELWGCGSNSDGELGLGDDIKLSKLTKIPIENVQQITCSTFNSFSLAYDGSSYYVWGKTKYDKWSSPKKLDDYPTSFVAASIQVLNSPITFGLRYTFFEFGSHDSISYKSIFRFFDNQDNYDVEFKIGKKRIKACKRYLKSVSEYYRRTFSGIWFKKDEVTIENYSYETYYAYLRKLHTGKIHINRQIITELVDLANCYGDIKLIEYCQTFIRSDLNEQTMITYLPLITKYEMKELYYELSQIAIEQVLPKVTDNIRQNNENSIEFLNWFYNQRRPIISK